MVVLAAADTKPLMAVDNDRDRHFRPAGDQGISVVKLLGWDTRKIVDFLSVLAGPLTRSGFRAPLAVRERSRAAQQVAALSEAQVPASQGTQWKNARLRMSKDRDRCRVRLKERQRLV